MCLDNEDVTMGDLCGLIAHESVHIADFWCDYMKETKPGEEIYAYMVQSCDLSIISELGDAWAKKK